MRILQGHKQRYIGREVRISKHLLGHRIYESFHMKHPTALTYISKARDS